ncbi:MAG TPA: copper oxidase [Acidobacteriaceae bacterium]|nr:copper oxidase [Acidobacteriaceae bacterium]
MSNRRSFLQTALGLGAGLFAQPRLLAASQHYQESERGPASPSAEMLRQNRLGHRGAAPPVSVITTDVGDLPFTMENGVKVFRLTAQVIQRQIAPDKTIYLWGFNGSAPGPTIQVHHGDRVRVIVRNELPEPTSMHWHGFEDRIGYDGMPGISQEPILPGEQFTYEFDIHQAGTYFYHSHMAMQEMAGMLGGFIMHPKVPYRPHCDKDFLVHLQEYAVLPNNMVPNSMSMEYNWLVLNGRSGPATTPLIVRQGDYVRIRFVNLGMDHHPMHIHGHTFFITGTEGGRIPETAWWPGNTVLVGVAQARDIEFVANNPGDWMLHCHLPHHMMNQMASNVGPVSRVGTGMPAGAGMKNGMGMLDGSPGTPTGSDYGPSLGRGMGFGSTQDNATTNGPLSNPDFNATMRGMQQEMRTGKPEMGRLQMRNMMAMDMHSMKQQDEEIAPNAGNVPNFPQDAYMEGPMMLMDDKVKKPENYGLRPGWSRFMQGMMTFIRVLPPEKYDEVIAQMKQATHPGDPYMSLLERS